MDLGLMDPGLRVPGIRDPGPWVPGLRDPGLGTQGGPGNPGVSLEISGIVVSLEIPGIVVSLVISIPVRKSFFLS